MNPGLAYLAGTTAPHRVATHTFSDASPPARHPRTLLAATLLRRLGLAALLGIEAVPVHVLSRALSGEPI